MSREDAKPQATGRRHFFGRSAGLSAVRSENVCVFRSRGPGHYPSQARKSLRVPELRHWALPREIPVESTDRSYHEVFSSHGESDHNATNARDVRPECPALWSACHAGSPGRRHLPPSASLNHAASILQDCFSDDVNSRLALRCRNGAADSLQQRLAFIRALRKTQAGLAKKDVDGKSFQLSIEMAEPRPPSK